MRRARIVNSLACLLLAVGCAARTPPRPELPVVVQTPAAPVGLAMRAGLVLDGESSLCCRVRLSPDDAVPVLMRDCVVIAHDASARMQCYDDGFEAVVSRHRARVRADGFVEVLPDGYEHASTTVEVHICRAVISCPGSEEPLACEARGAGARCMQDSQEGTVTCKDADGEQVTRCPVPRKEEGRAELAPKTP